MTGKKTAFDEAPEVAAARHSPYRLQLGKLVPRKGLEPRPPLYEEVLYQLSYRGTGGVNGGAIVLGHSIGATGSILIGTLLDELERRDLKRGLVTMCAAGMAPAVIVERV